MVLRSPGRRTCTAGQGIRRRRREGGTMCVRTEGQMGSADPPGKMDEKLKSKKSFFYVYVILESNRGRQVRPRERRYADHIVIQTYFIMHHFVVRFSQFSSPQAARWH